MNNLPANPLLHSLIFLTVAVQSTIGVMLYFSHTHQEHPLLLNLHLGLTAVGGFAFVIWLWKLNLMSRLIGLVKAPNGSVAAECKTLLQHLKDKQNPGTQYPLLTDAVQLLGLGALALTLITAGLYRAALSPLAGATNNDALFWPYGIAMALLACFIVGHAAMAALHRIEQQG